jgi:peptide/nickel transport system ATP-binding protein
MSERRATADEDRDSEWATRDEGDEADGDDGPRPATAGTGETPLVEVRGLEKYFYEEDTLIDRLLGGEPTAVRAVDGISFDIRKGETLGLVGESGCGKSTVGETVLRLQEPTGGTVRFDGEDLDEYGDLTLFRRRAGIVFQDPFSSLDPRMTVGEIVRQPLAIHGVGTREKRHERAADLIERVGLSAEQLERYPHEFSGGQRQRIGIARALALEPEFVVLDEPTSALDVSVQAQILNLLSDLQDEMGLTYLFISHDLSVIRHICDRVAVMYLGELVEIAPATDLFADPQHPYTQALLESVPRVDTAERERDVEILSGDVPSPRNPPSGCRFRTRCPEVIPPEDCDLSQDAYRAVMDLRGRVEEGSLPVAQVRREGADDADPETVARRLQERVLAVALPADHAGEVREALVAVAEGREGEAAATLRERYESVCETTHPAGERATCHLLEDR